MRGLMILFHLAELSRRQLKITISLPPQPIFKGWLLKAAMVLLLFCARRNFGTGMKRVKLQQKTMEVG